MSIESRLKKLELLSIDLEKSISIILSEISKPNHNIMGEESRADIQMKDQIWYCKNCKSKVGIIDRSTSEVRVRYKDHIIFCSLEKGYIKTPCRRCSYMNELKVDV